MFELASDFFVAAALDEQIQHLLVMRRNFDGLQIGYDGFSSWLA